MKRFDVTNGFRRTIVVFMFPRLLFDFSIRRGSILMVVQCAFGFPGVNRILFGFCWKNTVEDLYRFFLLL